MCVRIDLLALIGVNMNCIQVSQLKKALVCQAEGVITLSGHCQQLYASQMQLIDLLPDTPVDGSNTVTGEWTD